LIEVHIVMPSDVCPSRATFELGCDVIDGRLLGAAQEIGDQKIAPVEACPSPLRPQDVN